MKYTEVNPFTGKNIDEDAPANATGPSVAGTGDDSSVVVVRKKKKKDTLYDGRTRIARKFIERILKQRESRRLNKEEVEEDFRGYGKHFALTLTPTLRKKVMKLLDKEKIEYDKFSRKFLFIGKDGGKAPISMKDQKSILSKIEKEIGKDNFNYTFQKEEVELEEALKPKDKKVVDAFYDGKSMKGDTLSTDGKKLEKSGLGAQTIATSSGGKFKVVAKMDGKHTQSVVSYIKKSFPKNVLESVKEETMEITEEVMTLKTKDNVMGLKVFNSAKGLGLKAALLGKYVRVKGSKKQINDFGRTVIGKSSMGSPTDVGDFGKGSPTPQEDKMLNKRLKEEKLRNFTNFVLETADDFGVEYLLAENNLKILQNIVKKKQNAKMKFKDNKRATVDLFTASAIMKVYDAVKPDNKKKMEKLINGTLPEFLKLQSFAMKQVKMK